MIVWKKIMNIIQRVWQHAQEFLFELEVGID